MKYAVVFFLLALVVLLYAWMIGGFGWVLAWPAFSFLLVAAGYAGLGAGVLGKRPDGRLSSWSLLLLLPYFLLTWAVWHIQRWLSREDCWNEVVPGIYLGRRAFARELPPVVGLVVDLTAEFAEPRAVRTGREYVCLPILDAQAPDEQALRELIETLAKREGPMYLHCAVGHGRSALVVAALLLARGLVHDAKEADALVRKARPGVRLKPPQRELLDRRFLPPAPDNPLPSEGEGPTGEKTRS